MNTPVRNHAAAGGWRALASDSIVVTFLRRAAVDAPVGDPIADSSTDECAVRLAKSSRVIRAIARPGELLVAAWPDSTAAAGTSRWLSIQLDVRVRLVAITAAVAALTHIALTRFRAPQPTPTVRTVWIVALVLLASTAVLSRPIAAAWTEWRERRTRAHEGAA
jgi:hypothetical protein